MPGVHRDGVHDLAPPMDRSFHGHLTVVTVYLGSTELVYCNEVENFK